MPTNLLDDLRRHYEANGISAANFICRHQCKCSQGCEDTFIGPREAFVGTNYERGVLPRILFVGLDSGSTASGEPAQRTLEWVREYEENVSDICQLKKTSHWYRTQEMTLTFLRKFRGDLDLKEVKPYFAHTNSAKCSQGETTQNANILYENCREYLLGEVVALRPDIIISQGRKAEEAMEATKAVGVIEEGGKHGECPYSILQVSGRRVLWIKCYHPTSRAQYFPRQWKNCRDFWADVALKFIKTVKPDCL